MNADEAMRVRQGACITTSPDVLWELARDPSVTVRASLALNPALPQPVIAMLAADTDARVRTILNRKLASLTPALTDDARQQVQRDAVASLTAIVADAALRVRLSIVDAVRDMPDGPREIILRLAHDPAVMVCEPVIRCSPMLTRDDLVTLIASGPPPSTIVAVARRPNIHAVVSDAIVGTADTAAIGALLANPTAQIRETTLDALAAQSEEQTAWQEPLVQRPHLSPRAQRMLSEIVTGHLLETLAARSDLDPKAGMALRSELERLRTGTPAIVPGRPNVLRKVSAGSSGAEAGDLAAHAALAQALALNETGKLNEYAILDALRRNATVSATAMLAVKAGVPVTVIDRACGLRSSKAIVSLAWKAGLSAQTAVVLQAMLACLAPDLVLRPSQGSGFPLSEDEMRWQLAFLGGGETESRTWTPRRLS
jgi:uncharacterized protein (DUF2336 family)